MERRLLLCTEEEALAALEAAGAIQIIEI